MVKRAFLTRQDASGHLPDFVMSTHADETPIPFDFRKEVVESFRFIRERFFVDYLSDVSKKNLLKDLPEILFPVPFYCSIFVTRPGEDVSCRVKNICMSPCIKTFSLSSTPLPFQ